MNSPIQQTHSDDSNRPSYSQRNPPNRPLAYQKVDEECRKSLIDNVITQGFPLRQIALSLGIKYSTAKAIIQVYQNEGRIGKKARRDKRIYSQIDSFIIIVSKRTGEMRKMRIKSESDTLNKNVKLHQDSLEQSHYEQLAQAMLMQSNVAQESQTQQLLRQLNEQHQKLMQQ